MPANLVEESVEGYESFKTRITQLEKAAPPPPRIFVLFTGSDGVDGKSWCPDCNDFEAVFSKLKPKVDGMVDAGSIFLRAHVGNRDSWKCKDSKFRVDLKLKLTSVPTLIDWSEPAKRLSDNQILKEDNLLMLFEE